MYIKQYEARKQLDNESPLEYLEAKRYLLQRAGSEADDRTEKRQVRDILQGLQPTTQRFCEQKIKDPLLTEAQKAKMATIEGIESVLKWAEACLLEIKKEPTLPVPITQAQELVLVNNVTRKQHKEHNQYQGGRTQDSRMGNTNFKENDGNLHSGKKLTEFERLVLDKLNKLDQIENDLAVVKDRVDLLEKASNLRGVNTKGTEVNNTSQGYKCYNCDRANHYARDCRDKCRACVNSNHAANVCPKYQNERDARASKVNCIENCDHQDFQRGALQN